MRLDQWLWAVRLFKTRALAVEAIRGGRVKVNGNATKPAHEVKAGETITASTGSHLRTVCVITHPTSRVGAKLVPLYYDDLTPPPHRRMSRPHNAPEAQAAPRSESVDRSKA